MEFPKGKDAKFFWYIIILGVGIFIISFGMEIRRGKMVMLEHSRIEFEEIKGKVSSVTTDRSMIVLKLVGKRETPYYFWNDKNPDNDSWYLKNFIKPNDSIYKARNSLKLEIIKNEESFYFDIK